MEFIQFTRCLLLSSACFVAVSCQHEAPAPEATTLIRVSYAQTYCADKWGQAVGAQQFESVATAYLTQQGITASQLSARVRGPALLCNACVCTIGLVLEGLVPDSDMPTLESLGFKKI
jgi:hypothetical protein